MMKCFAILAATGLAFAALPAFAADGELLMCRYKGYTADGQYYYIAVKPVAGDEALARQLNDSEFAHAMFANLAPGNRFSGETACAMRPAAATRPYALVVEDEPSLVELIRYNLVKEGYEVAVAGDGEEPLLADEGRLPGSVLPGPTQPKPLRHTVEPPL